MNIKTEYTLPFSRGVNFSAWFEAPSAEKINFHKYTEDDFAAAKSLGVEAVRIPINLHGMVGPSYTIDPLFFELFDKAVDWAEKYGLYIIIDNHSFDPVKATSRDIAKVLFPVWEQMAEHYKDRSDYVLYEVLNEPHGIDDSLWGNIQGEAIEKIRRIDPRHYIIVGGTNYNSLDKLSAIPRYTDSKLIYTFHFYDPYVFTHQGETWGAKPNLANLRGVPFPPDRKRMPGVPRELKNTWVEGNLKDSYFKDGSPETLAARLDKALTFSNERGVPVFCGEFGVYIRNSQNEDRIRWYSLITSLLNERNIAWTIWDYYGGFGIFNRMDRAAFPQDLNAGLVTALGFTMPPF